MRVVPTDPPLDPVGTNVAANPLTGALEEAKEAAEAEARLVLALQTKLVNSAIPMTSLDSESEPEPEPEPPHIASPLVSTVCISASPAPWISRHLVSVQVSVF